MLLRKPLKLLLFSCNLIEGYEILHVPLCLPSDKTIMLAMTDFLNRSLVTDKGLLGGKVIWMYHHCNYNISLFVLHAFGCTKEHGFTGQM